MAEVESEPVKPWRWPGLWSRDEKFWRDVASRTASGLLVALVVYLFALLGGYIARPDAVPVLYGAAGVLLSILFWTNQAKLWRRMYGPSSTWREEQPKYRRRNGIFGVCFLLYFAGLVLILLFMDGK